MAILVRQVRKVLLVPQVSGVRLVKMGKLDLKVILDQRVKLEIEENKALLVHQDSRVCLDLRVLLVNLASLAMRASQVTLVH